MHAARTPGLARCSSQTRAADGPSCTGTRGSRAASVEGLMRFSGFILVLREDLALWAESVFKASEGSGAQTGRFNEPPVLLQRRRHTGRGGSGPFPREGAACCKAGDRCGHHLPPWRASAVGNSLEETQCQRPQRWEAAHGPSLLRRCPASRPQAASGSPGQLPGPGGRAQEVTGPWGEAFFPRSPGMSLDPTQGLAQGAAELAWSAGPAPGDSLACILQFVGRERGRGRSELRLCSSDAPARLARFGCGGERSGCV